jgi:hypothetical protein
MALTILGRLNFCLDFYFIFHYLPNIALKDKALLESNLSVRVMPRQKAQGQKNLSLGRFCFGRLSDKLIETVPPKAVSLFIPAAYGRRT